MVTNEFLSVYALGDGCEGSDISRAAYGSRSHMVSTAVFGDLPGLFIAGLPRLSAGGTGGFVHAQAW
jgi:hypothetical protein